MLQTKDPFLRACDDMKALERKYSKGCVLAHDQVDVGALLGFALDSETLQPQALIEACDLQLRASPAAELEKTGRTRDLSKDHFAATCLSLVSHRKGGVYVRAGEFLRGLEILVLYISREDGIAWLRPKAMFEDGRFTTLPDQVPLDFRLFK